MVSKKEIKMILSILVKEDCITLDIPEDDCIKRLDEYVELTSKW